MACFSATAFMTWCYLVHRIILLVVIQMLQEIPLVSAFRRRLYTHQYPPAKLLRSIKAPRSFQKPRLAAIQPLQEISWFQAFHCILRLSQHLYPLIPSINAIIHFLFSLPACKYGLCRRWDVCMMHPFLSVSDSIQGRYHACVYFCESLSHVIHIPYTSLLIVLDSLSPPHDNVMPLLEV